MSKFKELIEERIAKIKSEEPNCDYGYYAAIEDIIETLPDYDRGYMSGKMEMLNDMGRGGKEIFWVLERMMNNALEKAGL